jgi:hypothetical protein
MLLHPLIEARATAVIYPCPALDAHILRATSKSQFVSPIDIAFRIPGPYRLRPTLIDRFAMAISV